MGGVGIYSPHMKGAGGAGNSCEDFIFNSEADVQAAFPRVGNTYTLGSGRYCWGAFNFTVGRNVVIPSAARVEFHGHGPQSIVGGAVDGPLFDFQPGSEADVHDFNMRNLFAASTAICAQLDSDQLRMVNMQLECPDGACVRQQSGRILVANVDLRNCQDGIRCGGGTGTAESAWSNVRVFQPSRHAVLFDADYSTFVWTGGRADGVAGQDAVDIDCGADQVASVNLIGVEFQTWDDIFKHTSGTVLRASMVGCTASGSATLVDWAAANAPANGLSVVGNVTSIAAGAFIQNHTVNSARVNYKANSVAGAQFSETPIVP